MREMSEYPTLMNLVLQHAWGLARAMFLEGGDSRGKDVFEFIGTHGCLGVPAGQRRFTGGNWLYRGKRASHPALQHDAVTVVPCFSDDVPPRDPEGDTNCGVCMAEDQVIVLHNVDWWSPLELALFFLHEARHARHLIGPSLVGITPYEHEEDHGSHETNTWMFMMALMGYLSGDSRVAWLEAVRKERDWIQQQGLRPVSGGFDYVRSKQYWPELDQIFSTTTIDSVRDSRMVLTTVQAHMEYWSTVSAEFTAANTCHAIVSFFESRRPK